MSIRIDNLVLQPGERESKLKSLAENALGCQVCNLKILRKSLDARKKRGRQDIKWVYHIVCDTKNPVEEERAIKYCASAKKWVYNEYSFPEGRRILRRRPVVVGTGPAGLFCALMLARAGVPPIVLERGKPIEERVKDIENYRSGGILQPESNLQFGEGGAGTFSDGKLNTGVNDPRMAFILRQFVHFGAPKEILYLAAPHIGTDYLKKVVLNMREELISLGAEIRFNSRFCDLEVRNNRLVGVCYQPSSEISAVPEKLAADALCLAVGHSAHDTFQMLFQAGIPMAQKNFAVGVRIEHLQKDISFSQYGDLSPLLPPASYKLSCHLPNGRSAFSFCVCPGGEVMAASSAPERVATNGMSEYSRNGKNINGALLIGVGPDDYPSSHPLAGLVYQRDLEHKAWILGGRNGYAPAQTVGDFLAGRPSSGFSSVYPSYLPGVMPTDLHNCLPLSITNSLEQALPILGTKLKGYDDAEAVLTAVESRSSCPLRILRDENGESSVSGLFPCGEGAGYAGGIMSAAADGIRCAEHILFSDVRT